MPRSRAIARVWERPWPLVVWTAMIGWSAALFALVRSHFLEFGFQRFDLGNMVQAVWSTTEGRPLEMTLATGEQTVRFASHVDPILVLFAPLWLLAPTPLLLAGAQIAACALGALPVFWLGRRHLESEKTAALFALAYLAYPWLAWTALDAMHPVTLAIPFFLFAIWFLDTDRLWAFGACAVFVLACGELMGLPLAGVGLWYWLARGHRSAGLVIAATGIAWTLLAVEVIVPLFHGAESPFYSYFESIGGSPEGVVRTAFTDPAAIARALFTQRDLVYLLLLAVPLAGAFLLAPMLAAAAIPALTSNALSSIVATTDPRGHHVSAVIPFLVAASIFGVARLPGTRRAPAAAVILALSVGTSAAFGPWPLSGDRPQWLHSEHDGPRSADHVAALRDAVALVPEGAPAAATNKAGSHLSARRYFFSVPTLGNAEWVVIDMYDAWTPLLPRDSSRRTWGSWDLAAVKALRARLEESTAWRGVFERDRVVVFQKVTS